MKLKAVFTKDGTVVLQDQKTKLRRHVPAGSEVSLFASQKEGEDDCLVIFEDKLYSVDRECLPGSGRVYVED